MYKDMRVYLTGGFEAEAKKVHYLNLIHFSWHDAPSLNDGRNGHGSICQSKNLHVFGGCDNRGSIESLEIGEGHSWQIICEPTTHTRRENPAVALISD